MKLFTQNTNRFLKDLSENIVAFELTYTKLAFIGFLKISPRTRNEIQVFQNALFLR